MCYNRYWLHSGVCTNLLRIPGLNPADACVFYDSRRKLRDENIYDPSWRDGLE